MQGRLLKKFVVCRYSKNRIAALEWIVELGFNHVLFFMDSKLVVDQVNRHSR